MVDACETTPSDERKIQLCLNNPILTQVPTAIDNVKADVKNTTKDVVKTARDATSLGDEEETVSTRRRNTGGAGATGDFSDTPAPTRVNNTETTTRRQASTQTQNDPAPQEKKKSKKQTTTEVDDTEDYGPPTTGSGRPADGTDTVPPQHPRDRTRRDRDGNGLVGEHAIIAQLVNPAEHPTLAYGNNTKSNTAPSVMPVNTVVQL